MNFLAEQYGILYSVRHQARKTMDLLNAITTKFGISINWFEGHYNFIDRKGFIILFRRRGNKYADWLELASYDIEVLKQIKQAFPDDFHADVKIEQGPL